MPFLATAGAVLFAFAIVLFVLEPLLTGRSALLQAEDRADNEAFRKHAALRALRDLEYDFQTGKLDEGDYRALKRELVAEAAEVLYDGAAGPTDSVEAEIRTVRQRMRAGTACTHCGAEVLIEGRFCASCGAPLGAASPT